MIVKNPTEKDIYIVYQGTTYAIDAKSEINNVPLEVATHWQKKVHEFVQVEAESTTKKAVVNEAVDVVAEVLLVADADVEVKEEVKAGKEVVKKVTKK